MLANYIKFCSWGQEFQELISLDEESCGEAA